MSDKERLYPCPFCGGGFEWIETGDDQYPHIICCENEECSGCNDVGFATVKEAQKAWNTRADQAKVEALERKIQSAEDAIEIYKDVNQALEQANFKLSAGLCIISGGLIGDDHGHPVCNILQELENEVCLNNGLKIQNKEQAERIKAFEDVADTIRIYSMIKPPEFVKNVLCKNCTHEEAFKQLFNLLDKG